MGIIWRAVTEYAKKHSPEETDRVARKLLGLDEEVWRTTEEGHHIKIESTTGEIKAGMGGKFNGQKIGTKFTESGTSSADPKPPKSTATGSAAKRRLKSVEEAIKGFCGPDNYMTTPKYKSAIKRWRDSLKEDERVSKEWRAVRDQLEKEIEFPDDEAREMGRQYADFFGWYTDKGKKLQKKERELREKVKDAEKERDDASEELDAMKLDQRLKERLAFDPEPLKETKRTDFEGFSVQSDVIQDLIDNGKAKIVEMAPREYLERCAMEIFNSTLENTISGMNVDNANEYADKMESGDKFPIPYLDYGRSQQEGRHRALAALLNGYKTIPVAIVGKEVEPSMREESVSYNPDPDPAEIESLKKQISGLSRFGEQGKLRKELTARLESMTAKPEEPKQSKKPAGSVAPQEETEDPGHPVTPHKERQFASVGGVEKVKPGNIRNTRELKEFLDGFRDASDNGYEYFGLRVDKPGKQVGEALENSHQLWQDDPEDENIPYNEKTGFWDGGELNGVSTIGIERKWTSPEKEEFTEEDLQEALERVSGYGLGDKTVYVVAGTNAEGGNDIGESILENGKIIGVLPSGTQMQEPETPYDPEDPNFDIFEWLTNGGGEEESPEETEARRQKEAEQEREQKQREDYGQNGLAEREYPENLRLTDQERKAIFDVFRSYKDNSHKTDASRDVMEALSGLMTPELLEKRERQYREDLADAEEMIEKRKQEGYKFGNTPAGQAGLERKRQWWAFYNEHGYAPEALVGEKGIRYWQTQRKKANENLKWMELAKKIAQRDVFARGQEGYMPWRKNDRRDDPSYKPWESQDSALALDEEVWRTSEEGRHFKLETATGEIKKGFGGKFNGEKVGTSWNANTTKKNPAKKSGAVTKRETESGKRFAEELGKIPFDGRWRNERGEAAKGRPEMVSSAYGLGRFYRMDPKEGEELFSHLLDVIRANGDPRNKDKIPSETARRRVPYDPQKSIDLLMSYGYSKEEAKDTAQELITWTHGAWRTADEKVLEKYISSRPDYHSGQMFRGIHVDKENLQKLLSDAKTGTLSFGRISSWSEDAGVAATFSLGDYIKAGETPVVFNVGSGFNRTGVSVQEFTAQREAEIITGAKTKWSVLSVRKGHVFDVYGKKRNGYYISLIEQGEENE